MTKSTFFFILFALLCSFKPRSTKPNADEITWEQLSNIILKEVWSDTYKMKINKVTFPPEVKKLNGKIISITGFLIPVTTYGNEYVISANPYSGCYFCGNAGIESIIELKFEKNNIRYKIDRYIVVEGKLLLNEADGIGFIYTLQNAKEVM